MQASQVFGGSFGVKRSRWRGMKDFLQREIDLRLIHLGGKDAGEMKPEDPTHVSRDPPPLLLQTPLK